MSMLSDYQRMVEAPMIRSYEATIKSLREKLAASEAELSRLQSLSDQNRLTGGWRAIDDGAPRDGTVFVACNLDHPSFGSWPMHRRVRHFYDESGNAHTEDLGGWNHLSDLQHDPEADFVGPSPAFSIALDDLNTSVRYGWQPLPLPGGEEKR